MEIITTLIDWYHSLGQKEKIFFMIALFAWIYLFYKLARSEDVDESGRVVVTYHSPFTWLKRFNAQVAKNRAGYSGNQKSLLSKLWVGGKLLRSLLAFMLSLLLFTMAYFIRGTGEYFWYVIMAAIFFLFIFISQVRSAGSNDNPFRKD